MNQKEALQKQKEVLEAQRKVLDASIALLELQIAGCEYMENIMVPLDFTEVKYPPYFVEPIKAMKPLLPYPQVMCSITDGINPERTMEYAERMRTMLDEMYGTE